MYAITSLRTCMQYAGKYEHILGTGAEKVQQKAELERSCVPGNDLTFSTAWSQESLTSCESVGKSLKNGYCSGFASWMSFAVMSILAMMTVEWFWYFMPSSSSSGNSTLHFSDQGASGKEGRFSGPAVQDSVSWYHMVPLLSSYHMSAQQATLSFNKSLFLYLSIWSLTSRSE